jgi:hypothetical protein
MTHDVVGALWLRLDAERPAAGAGVGLATTLLAC